MQGRTGCEQEGAGVSRREGRPKAGGKGGRMRAALRRRPGPRVGAAREGLQGPAPDLLLQASLVSGKTAAVPQAQREAAIVPTREERTSPSSRDLRNSSDYRREGGAAQWPIP